MNYVALKVVTEMGLVSDRAQLYYTLVALEWRWDQPLVGRLAQVVESFQKREVVIHSAMEAV